MQHGRLIIVMISSVSWDAWELLVILAGRQRVLEVRTLSAGGKINDFEVRLRDPRGLVAKAAYYYYREWSAP